MNITPEEQADLDIWLGTGNHALYLEDFWGLETMEFRYARIKQAKKNYEEMMRLSNVK